jgi:hypothetical protein
MGRWLWRRCGLGDERERVVGDLQVDVLDVMGPSHICRTEMLAIVPCLDDQSFRDTKRGTAQ